MLTKPHDDNIPPELAAYLSRAAPVAHPDIVDLFTAWKSPSTPSAFSRKAAQERGGWQATRQIQKEQQGVLRTVRDGKRVLTTAASLFPHLIERVIASHPAGTEKPRRQPTENELRALRAGNERRHQEALARKAPKTEVSQVSRAT
jgi:hypothetical protein